MTGVNPIAPGNSSVGDIKIIDVFAIVLSLSFAEFIPIVGTLPFKLLLFFSAILILVNEGSKKRLKLDVEFVAIFLFGCVCFYSNIRHNGDIAWSKNCLNIITISVFSYLCRSSCSEKPLLYFTLTSSSWIWISLFNVVATLGFKGADMSLHLLLCGYDNGLGSFLLPIYCLNLFYIHRGIHKQYFTAVSFAIFFQLLLRWTATALAGFVIVTVASAVFIFWRHSRKSLLLILTAVLIFVVVFIIYLKIYDFGPIKWLITSVFHKSMDFSGRTALWDIGFRLFERSPILGIGRNGEYQMLVFLGVPAAHNFLIDILDCSGAIGMGLFFIAFCNLDWRLRSERGGFFLCCFLCLLIAAQFESYSAYQGYPLYFLVMNLAASGLMLDESHLFTDA